MYVDKPRISRFVFVLFVLLCGMSPLLAQRSGKGWVWQNPSPQGNSLFSIHFAKDKETGFAVGSDNTILKTQNGGFSWQRQFSPLDLTLSAVFVRDKKNAVIVGTRGSILFTNNAGNDWKQVRIESRDHLYGLTFTGQDLLTGWATGTYGRILKSVDGGKTWSPQVSGITEHLLKIAAFDSSNVSSIGVNGTILTTANGGQTWKASNPCGVEMTGVSYLSADQIFAIGHGGCAVRSGDSGETWSRINLYSRADLLSVSFSDGKTGSMTDANGMIWLTGDGGFTWLPFNVRTSPKLVSLYFADNFTGWAVGEDGLIVRTDDGGYSCRERR